MMPAKQMSCKLFIRWDINHILSPLEYRFSREKPHYPLTTLCVASSCLCSLISLFYSKWQPYASESFSHQKKVWPAWRCNQQKISQKLDMSFFETTVSKALTQSQVKPEEHRGTIPTPKTQFVTSKRCCESNKTSTRNNLSEKRKQGPRVIPLPQETLLLTILWYKR